MYRFVGAFMNHVQSGRFKALGLLALACIASLNLGGCNKDKQTIEQLTTENQQLRTERDGLEQQNSQLKGQYEQLLGTIANNPQPQPQPQPYNDPGTGGGGKKRTGGGGGGGGGGTRTDIERLTVAGDVLFSAGSDVVSSGGKKELDKVASKIKSKYKSNHIRVEGYTDSDPIRKSKWPSNEALSAARAAAVEKYLITRGISSSRIESVGMGAAKAKGSKAASRRVEIVILSN